MKLAIAMLLLAAAAAFNLGSPPAHAVDMVDYRANHKQGDCRVVEVVTTNRWGTDVTIRRLVCGLTPP